MDNNNKSNGTSKRFAAWMQRRFEGLSRKGKITAGLLTLMLAGCYCGLLVLGGISGKTKNVLSIDPIKVPVSIGRAIEAPASAISAEELGRIQRFRGYMDSLARSPSGRLYHDSLVRIRPGLMDSIAVVEDIYQRQSNKGRLPGRNK